MPHSDLGPRARLLLTSKRASSMCALTLKGDRGATFLHGFLLDVGVNLHVPLTEFYEFTYLYRTAFVNVRGRSNASS
jgi:hypothetical protein